MTFRVDTFRQTDGQAAADGVRNDQAAEGSFQGQRVSQQQDAASMIADAAEELTFSTSETVEKKKISERKVSKKGMVNRNAKAEMMVKKIPDLDKDALLKFAQKLLSSSGQSAGQIKEELRRQFKDPSHQHAALEYIQELLAEEGGDGELQAAVAEAKDTLLAEEGPRIRAGLNVSPLAAGFAEKGLGGVQTLRDFYRDAILGHEDIETLHAAVIQRYPGKDFQSAVDFLIKAVGADLQSKGPSVDPVELKQTLDDLYHLESLGNLHRNAGELIGKTEKLFQAKTGLDPSRFVAKVMDLKKERWISEKHAMSLVEMTGIKDVEARIYFLRGATELVRKMPLKLFPDEDKRVALLNKMREAMDTLVEEEDELG